MEITEEITFQRVKSKITYNFPFTLAIILQLNTYQIAIISSDQAAYVEFLYADNGIQWLQGEGIPGTGLPDAKAQAGFVAANGRTYTLPGSGTDQIRNLVR